MREESPQFKSMYKNLAHTVVKSDGDLKKSGIIKN
jgi:hypothetical protein